MIAPRLVPFFQKGFAWSARLLLNQAFGGIYLARDSAYGGDKAWPSERPLFLYSTHTSWWDPLVAAHLSVNLMKLRAMAPMDAEQFRRYRSLRFVGIFGVEKGDGPEVEALISEELEKNPETAFWVTPTGVFSPNEVPLPEFREGLSRWTRTSGYARIPVVVHYSFGPAPRPTIFLSLGEAVPVGTKPSLLQDLRLLRRHLQKQTESLLTQVHRAQSGNRFDESAFYRLA